MKTLRKSPEKESPTHEIPEIAPNYPNGFPDPGISENINHGVLSNYSSSAFSSFLNSLGQLKDVHVSLQKYARSIPLEQNEKYITVQMYQNNLKKMISCRYIRKNWYKNDTMVLIWVIQKYKQLYKKSPQEFETDDWNIISSLVPSRNSQQCMFRWLTLQKNQSTQKYPWTPIQDNILKQLIQNMNQKRSKKWYEISKQLYLQNTNKNKVYRTGKQCRERYSSFLNPHLKKTPWEYEEDIKLLSEYLKIGKKWARISKKIIGRTQNAIKNRFELIVQKKTKSKYKKIGSIEDFIKIYLNNLMEKSKINNYNIIQQKQYQIQHQKQFKKIPISKEFLKQQIPLRSFTRFSIDNDSEISKQIPMDESKKIQSKQKNSSLQYLSTPNLGIGKYDTSKDSLSTIIAKTQSTLQTNRN